MGLDDDSHMDGAIDAKTKKGQKRPMEVLAAWDLPAAKLLRPGKRSTIDQAESYEELWRWMQVGNEHQPYRSELCSNDPIIRGVAISRFAEGLVNVCEAILTDKDLQAILSKEHYGLITKEADILKKKVSILNGAGLPSRAGGKKPSIQFGSGDDHKWKPIPEVETAIEYLEGWIAAPSQIRRTMKVLGLGGLFYTTYVDSQCIRSYLKVGPGKESGTMRADAVSRLCQSGAVKASGTKMDNDAMTG